MAQQVMSDASPTQGVDHRGFWKVLERFAGTLVDKYDLDDVLEQLGADITAVLDVAGAGVMLADAAGALRFCSTNNEVLHKLEALQVDLDEGPCLLAYRTSEIVLADDLRSDPRFPNFGPRALEAGMAAVYSFPMRLDQQVIGALNLYNDEPGPFSDDQIEVGGVFADVGTTYLLNARDIAQQDLLTRQLQEALNSRVLIEQAKGYVSALAGVEPTDAFELIRGYARRHQVRVRMIARSLLHGDLALDELTR
ncbi:MAG TPA: GAF and ANTAR domain-containing protein [Euzebyales bacterium]